MKTQSPGTASSTGSYPKHGGAANRPVERRVNDRFRVQGVFVYADGAVRGRVLDLSSGGLSLLTARRVQPGQDISFRITSEYRTVVSGRVCWSRLERVRAREDGGFEPLYAAGLSLLHDPHKCRTS